MLTGNGQAKANEKQHLLPAIVAVLTVAFQVTFGFLNLGTQPDIVRLVIISIGTTVAIITILFWTASAALPTARRRYQSITCAFFVIAAGTATMILAARFHNIYISRTVKGHVVAADFYAALTASELKLTFYTQPEEPLTFKGMSTHDSILIANLEVEMKSDKQFVLTNFHVPQHITLRYELAHPAGLHVTREPTPQLDFSTPDSIKAVSKMAGIIGGTAWLLTAALVFLFSRFSLPQEAPTQAANQAPTDKPALPPPLKEQVPQEQPLREPPHQGQPPAVSVPQPMPTQDTSPTPPPAKTSAE